MPEERKKSERFEILAKAYTATLQVRAGATNLSADRLFSATEPGVYTLAGPEQGHSPKYQPPEGQSCPYLLCPQTLSCLFKGQNLSSGENAK